MTTELHALHAHSGNIFGGVETLLSTLARWQSSAPGVRHSFALCFEGELADQLAQEGAGWHSLQPVRVSRPWTVVRARKRFARVIDEVGPELVMTHSAWSHAIFAPVARKRGIRLVYWMHAPPSGRHWLERWAKRTPPDRVVCNSHFTAARSALLFQGVPSDVLYYAVAPPAASPPGIGATVRAAWETPEDAIVFAQTSRLEAWKGHRVFLAALARLADLPNWVAWIVGGAQTPAESNYLAELQERGAQLGIQDRIRFLGQHSDVSLVLRAADVLCQPNIEGEPFGIVFVEALYCGLPVVTTDFGGAVEIVDDTCGIRTPPGDVPAVAAALRRLIEDTNLRHELGRAGPARAAAVAAPARQVRRLAQVLVAARSPVESPG
ncbi:MAG: glycosyltransferase family 4 protein [Gemmatimonadetes bacterium]|nr:glycosyltransferase family 4 protein [Gemmatimonadota bacterium]